MTAAELKEYLVEQGYRYERDSEYNRDVLTKSDFQVDGKPTKLEIYIDRYSAKVVWWYEPNKKVGVSQYLSKIDLGIYQLMVQGLIDNNKPK